MRSPYTCEVEPRHLLVLQVAVVLVFSALGLAAYVVNGRRAALAEARADMRADARMMEDILRRTVAAADILLAAAELVPADRRADLLRLSAGFPRGLAVVPANGSGARRLAGGTRRPVVGALFRPRPGAAPVFPVTRGGPDRILVSAAWFHAQAAHTQAGKHDTALVLFDRQGRVVLRLPDPDRAVGRSFAGGPLAAVAAVTEGTARAVSPVDGVERIYAVRALPDLGLTVAAGRPLDVVLSPWRTRAEWTSAIFALVALAAGGLTTLAFRGMAREQALRRGLEEEVRQRTEEAHQSAEEARRAEAGKTRFLAAASHDLRQPMQASEMFAEVLAGRLTTPEQHHVLRALRTALSSANHLLATLLDASALEQGQVAPAVRPAPLAPIFDSLTHQVAPLAAQKKLALVVVPTGAVAVTDPTLLERMLRNLLVNAVRYTAAGTVLLGCRRRGAHVEIQVLDTGVGIPAGQLTRVFEDFTRLGEVRCEGLGLGLGVVRRMAELLELELSVASRPGRGSRFSVRVPLAADAVRRPAIPTAAELH